MKQTRISSGSYTLTLFSPGASASGLIVLPMASDRADGILRLLPNLSAACLFIDGVDWNRDLSPWPARAVFSGEEDFAGQADAFLDSLTHELIPLAEAALPCRPGYRALAGYSLAGLFSVYAAFRTDAFDRIASVSGSMWYDGFLAFAQETPFTAPVTRACFSVGAKEKRTRNLRMASVEDCTREMETLFRTRGAETQFTLHPGNHFTDPEGRIAAAVKYLAGENG